MQKTHTYQNILRDSEFCVNFIDYRYLDNCWATIKNNLEEIDEFATGKFTEEPSVIITSPRIAESFRNWVTDPEVSKFWSWKPHENIEETKSLLQGWINDYSKTDSYHWVIVIKELSEAIGYIYLNEINNEEKSASIHYLVSRKFWNQGTITEACRVVLALSFNKIGITKIHTHHHVDNPASGKVMQKSGMHYLETKYKEIPDCAQISGDYSKTTLSKILTREFGKGFSRSNLQNMRSFYLSYENC